MNILLIVISALGFFIAAILTLPAFGRMPSGKRLARIKALPNYAEGEIVNESPTPVKPDGVSYGDIITEVFKKNPKSAPLHTLPSVTPDFSHSENTKIIWFGHSSYFIHVDGLNILVDPVFSQRTSPFSFIGTKRFLGTDFIKPEDFPDLDIVMITHDHYDHLDRNSILKLNKKTKGFVTSLGVGAHLEHWGIAADRIKELAWNDTATINGLQFTAMPARHFSGRLFKRNQSVWSAFILKSANCNLYLGGDSGYDQHFKAAGAVYGPFDIAILECGQYNRYWPMIHMFPEQTVQAAMDLKAKVLLPVHWGKFKLSTHDWNEPIIRVTKSAIENGLKITTPMFGEAIVIDESYPDKTWWSEK